MFLSFQRLLKRTALATCLIILIVYWLLQTEAGGRLSRSLFRVFYPGLAIACYRIQNDSLPDISQADVRKGKSIFFHETSCNSFVNGKITVHARQACAVESALRANPDLDVYLLFTSPGLVKDEGTESDEIIQQLQTYPNLRMMRVNFAEYTQGTPLEDLYQTRKLDDSKFPVSHASDILRYLTLWKYGGIYLDLDVIVLKSLEDLPPNYSGAESADNVAAGVMSFADSGVGHSLAETCVNDLRKNFSGSEWGYNGPGTITRLLKRICGVDRAKDMTQRDCGGFKVYSPEAFYPVPWWDWRMYFEAKHLDEVERLTRNSYAMHVWNKHSADNRIDPSSSVPYVVYARKYCPRVISKCRTDF